MKTLKNYIPKKWVLSCLFVIGAATYGFSQSVVTIGPRLGGTLSWINNVEHLTPQPNLTGGVFIMYSRWEHFGLSADILYAGRGAYFKLPVGGESTATLDRRVLLHYIEVPILANYFFTSRQKAIRPRVMLGPSISYNLWGKHIGQGALDVSFPELDYSIVGGAGVNFKLSEYTWLNVDARYTMGLTDINQFRRIVFLDPVRSRTVGLMVGLGIGIDRDKDKTYIISPDVK